ncbi:hypothetical protein BQ9231_00054 [Cedratvirus lausannensis]|uniref:Uncharacterized protein n=1 Tax=Cedratvirus lausannensis TaxID=2023205 RepID=A0A285PXI1_9VIRU|nr:hypothetical protein BQ9231_00054 [Cedratvirus lausannensis]
MSQSRMDFLLYERAKFISHLLKLEHFYKIYEKVPCAALEECKVRIEETKEILQDIDGDIDKEERLIRAEPSTP